MTAAGVLVFFPALETLETVLILVAVGLAAGAVLGFFARPSLQSAAIATDLAALHRGRQERVPADYQRYVRHCFDSWVSDLQGAGGPTGPQPGEGPSSETGQP